MGQAQEIQEYLIKGIDYLKIGQCEDDMKIPFPFYSNLITVY